MIPHKPGVYIFKDSAGVVLYVGKAIDLNRRVASYGVNLSHPGGGIATHRTDIKTSALVDSVADVETILVESELEALILEANLIKKYLPPFNIKLTDDKDYLYIGLTKEDFPKVITARKKDLPGKKFWGPFPSSKTVKDTLKSLRKVFPWCSAPLNIQARPCFYYHLGLCPGVCIGLIGKEEYQKIINRFSRFMDGKKDELIKQLEKEMMQESKAMRFEEAAKIKKILVGVEYLTQPNRTKFYLENPNFLQQERQLSLLRLREDLGLKKSPDRIEGYDISNIQGKDATGSMVVLTHGEIDKSQYRKFKIRISGRPNDVGMMREMVMRRFRHPDWPIPDLIIVDGGRGQAKAAKYEILNTKYEIPIFGLAKRMEWLYPPEGEVLKLLRKSLSLKLLQRIRDEAHRFAISYHRRLHRRSTLNMI